MRWLLAPLLAACTAPAWAGSATDPVVPAGVETDRHAVGRLTPLAASADGQRLAWVWREPDARSSELRVAEGPAGAGPHRVLVAEGNPDRVAISPDGQRVAFVSGASGLASVFVVPFQGGEPVQLTNAGLRPGGGRPEGFVPPPHDHSLRFDGPWLRWNSPEGPQQVRWR